MKEVYFDDPRNGTILIESTNYVYEKVIENFSSFYRNSSGGAILYLTENGVKKALRIGADEHLGICLTYVIMSEKDFNGKIMYIDDITYLAVYDKSKLDSVIDIYDELYVSEGLFLPKELAWKGISEFINTGERSLEIEWISPDLIPENGNWC